MGNSNERTDVDTFKNQYEKRALDTSERYGKAKFYSKKSDASDMLMVKDYWTNNLDESTSYDEMVEIRKDINHENLAKTHAHGISQENQFFTEFYKHSTAHEYYDHNLYKEIAARKNANPPQSFSEEEVWYYSHSMLDMDEKLMDESMGTAHGDLQPKTIMLDDEANVKIIDNAIATNKGAYKKCCFNDDYFAPIAPEQLLDLKSTKVNPEHDYNDKGEVWSTGITALSAATGNYPEDYYDWKQKKYLRSKVQEDLDGLHGNKSPEQIAFIRKCLEEDPNKRWSVSEANEYFTPYRDLAKRKQLNFMNMQVDQTDEIGHNDFFDNQELRHEEVREVQGVQHVVEDFTNEIDGGDFFDNDDLRHEEVRHIQGVQQVNDNVQFF